MQRGVVWCSTLFLSVLIVPGLASGLPALREMDGFLDLSISGSTDCDGPGQCFAVDVAVDASMNPIEVLLFDLQVDWDPTFLELDAINFSDLLAVNSNGGSAGADDFGNLCDPDLDNDGDVDLADYQDQLECFLDPSTASIDCADADLVGSSLSDSDPEDPSVDGFDRLQLLRWLRDPTSVPGEAPAN